MCCIYCIIVQCFSSFISLNVIVFFYILMFIWYNLVSSYIYTWFYIIYFYFALFYIIYIYIQHGFVLNGERNYETNNVVYSNTRHCFAYICGLFTLTYYTCCFIVYVWTCFMVLVLIYNIIIILIIKMIIMIIIYIVSCFNMFQFCIIHVSSAHTISSSPWIATLFR